MLQADIRHPRELAPRDLAAWAEFRVAHPAFRSPLLSAEFAQAVSDVREDARVAVFKRDGRTLGFLPHHRRPAGLARPIGAPWSDYHALIGAPDAAIDGAEALKAAGLSAFRFNGLIDPHGVFAEAKAEAHDAYLIALSPGTTGETYWESLRAASPKRFKNMRRLEHKLAREVGEFSLVAPDVDQIAFDALLNWKSEQFVRTGLHDVLSPAWSRGLMQSLFERRDGPLQGLLISLKIGDRPIAAHFGVRLEGDYHPWIAAYDPEFSSYSPGMTFISEAIRAMPALGLTTYDMSAGSDHYKRPFASEKASISEGILRVAGGGLERSLGRLTHVLGARPAHTLRRVGRRLDHIASAELSLSGRMQGLATALAASSRRLEAGASSESED